MALLPAQKSLLFLCLVQQQSRVRETTAGENTTYET